MDRLGDDMRVTVLTGRGGAGWLRCCVTAHGRVGRVSAGEQTQLVSGLSVVFTLASDAVSGTRTNVGSQYVNDTSV